MSSFAYYNEFDPKAAAWIKQLIKNGLIADGEVDERSITEVTADEIRGFTQHHFFAGIGGWSYSLRLAGWADDRPVCTASLPCQPFSVAGAQKGVDDDRHLLPHFIGLVKQCNFQTIFGEQVPGAIKHGWLDDLCIEMEREKYTVGSIVLTAAGTGAPHIRQRLYWVADSINKGSQGRLSDTENGYGGGEPQLATSNVGESWDKLGRDGSCSGMGNTELHGHDASEVGRSISQSETEGRMLQSKGSDTVGRVCNTESNQEHPSATGGLYSKFSNERIINDWTDPDWLYCRDEKYRPIKSSSIWMVNGLSCRMVQCSDTSVAHIQTIEKEMKNAEKAITNTREVLPILQIEDGEEKILRNIGRHDVLYETEILQSRLHGESFRGCNEDNNITQQSSAIKETSKRMLSGVWKNTHTTCSSCGRESYKQLTIEFDDIVCKMPQGSTFAKFLGAYGSEYMQTLRQTSNENRALLDSQYTPKEVWASLNDQEKDRVRVHFNDRIWIFTDGLKPLSSGLPRGVGYSSDPSEPIDANDTQEARVMRLKGYGNAIVPQVTASFIKAFMEAEV